MHVNVKYCNFNSSLPRLDVLAHSKKYQSLLNRIEEKQSTKKNIFVPNEANASSANY